MRLGCADSREQPATAIFQMTTDDYVLGTHDAEIARLGLQHRVWRPYMLDAWISARMTSGSRVIDFGAGPGFAALDAAEIVGPRGEVLAIERSHQFLEFAQREIERRGASCVRLIAGDLMRDGAGFEGFDVAWCRWVASFVMQPAKLVQRIVRSLRIGGRAAIHEYQNYATWRMIPTSLRVDDFVREVMASWRDSGGEPDIAAALIPLMQEAGLSIIELRPLVFAVRPADFMWQWPAAFIQSNSQRLVELGKVSEQWAYELQSEFAALSANPNAVLVTPMVMQIIAERIR